MLYELAALGTPSATIATEPHEVYNVNYWSRIGSTVSLGYHETLDLEAVSETVVSLLKDGQRRAEMSTIGKQTVDGRGLARVMRIIQEALN
jgi:spore coat polysaccharide biosynthesis predicted glycosyltransferase SpsG